MLLHLLSNNRNDNGIAAEGDGNDKLAMVTAQSTLAQGRNADQ
jgi:hypothetical protein